MIFPANYEIIKGGTIQSVKKRRVTSWDCGICVSPYPRIAMNLAVCYYGCNLVFNVPDTVIEVEMEKINIRDQGSL